MAGATLLTLFWLLRLYGGLLGPFVFALAGAYLVSPAVDALTRRRVPRALAILLVTVLPLVVIALLVAATGPQLWDQFTALAGRIPTAGRDHRLLVRGCPDQCLPPELPHPGTAQLAGHARRHRRDHLPAAARRRHHGPRRELGAQRRPAGGHGGRLPRLPGHHPGRRLLPAPRLADAGHQSPEHGAARAGGPPSWASSTSTTPRSAAGSAGS